MNYFEKFMTYLKFISLSTFFYGMNVYFSRPSITVTLKNKSTTKACQPDIFYGTTISII